MALPAWFLGLAFVPFPSFRYLRVKTGGGLAELCISELSPESP
jgi:hypothetical protein